MGPYISNLDAKKENGFKTLTTYIASVHIKFQALNKSPHCQSGPRPMCNNCEFESLQFNVDNDSGV